jgi:site-specific DNA-adenine methylase
MRPMFSYMGSKWRLAKKYGAPKHNLVIEPFAGGACYSLYWEAPKVLLYDLNPAVAGIWKYLIAAKESEILSLPIEFETTTELDIPQEAKWLIGFWITKGNTNPNKRRSAWARQYQNSGNCLVWGEQTRARIAAQLQKIRDWQIRCEDYRNCPDILADWFIDPPYSVAGKAYKFSKIDYVELSDFCQNRRGRVIVCENEGATWMPFEPFAHAAGTHGKVRSGVSKEVVQNMNN